MHRACTFISTIIQNCFRQGALEYCGCGGWGGFDCVNILEREN